MRTRSPRRHGVHGKVQNIRVEKGTCDHSFKYMTNRGQMVQWSSGQRTSTSTVPCLRFEPFVLTSLLCRCIGGGTRAHLPVAARHQRRWLEVPPHALEKEFLQGDHANSFTRKPRAAPPRLLSSCRTFVWAFCRFALV